MSSLLETSLAVAKLTYRSTQHIGGWLNFDAVFASALLIATQHKFAAMEGGIATLEIGVHHGKYFVAFNSLYASLPGVVPLTSTAIDLFGAQDSNQDSSGKGDRTIFAGHVAAHLGERCTVQIVEGDSMALRAEQLPDQRLLHFASVDGGHHYECVRHDLALVTSRMREGGLISIDDFYHPGWAEVSVAVIQNLDRTLQPLAVAGGKLFLVKDSSSDRRLYGAWMVELQAALGFGRVHAVNFRSVRTHEVETKLQPFLGRELVYLRTYDQSPFVRVLRRTLSKVQF